MSSEKKRISKYRTIAQILIVAVAVILIIISLSNAIKKSVYSERQKMLSLVTSTAAEVVDENMAMEWNYVDILSSVVTDALKKEPDLETALASVSESYDFDSEYFYLVDESGKYFSSDGAYGKLADLAHYTSNVSDNEEFLSTLPHLDQNKTYMIFSKRLDAPIHIVSERGETEITYFSYAHDLSELKEKLDNLFPGAINIFICDETGAMLYKEFGIKLLIEGYNIYPKFSICELPFNEDPDELVQKVKDGKDIAVEMIINDKNYYFCSSRLETADWTIVIIAQSEYLGDITSSSFGSIIFYISCVVFILGLLCIYVFYATMKNKITAQRLEESQEVAEAMSEASRAKTDFLSNMSHDIRTPINGIMGMTAIAKKSDDMSRVKDCLDKIDGASRHLLSLINDVLDMSRIEKGRTEITAVPADIRVICDNCCSILNGQLESRDIEFTVEKECEHTAVMADELHLRQILINILGNAVKFTKDGGKIWFRCKEKSCDESNVTYDFEVEDTGIGMSEEFIGHIFEAFAQEAGGDRTQYKGTGLGMSISKELTGLMGGTIAVESRENEGSKFTVTIPFARDFEDRTEKIVNVSGHGIKGVKILLADDNDLNREIATELLEEAGATVDVSINGEETLLKFRDSVPGTYDVILMDIMMPKMNGLEATRAIRALDREDAKSITIIAMTANAFDEDVKASHEAGMNEHLSKPLNISEVIKAIASYM